MHKTGPPIVTLALKGYVKENSAIDNLDFVAGGANTGGPTT